MISKIKKTMYNNTYSKSGFAVWTDWRGL